MILQCFVMHITYWDDLPRVMRPQSEGGHLHHKAQVEVVSSLERATCTDGYSPPPIPSRQAVFRLGWRRASSS